MISFEFYINLLFFFAGFYTGILVMCLNRINKDEK